MQKNIYLPNKMDLSFSLEVQVIQSKWLVFRMIHVARIPDPTKWVKFGQLGRPGFFWERKHLPGDSSRDLLYP